MKFFPLLLALASVSFISCERHSFAETKALHEHHGAGHAEHAEGGHAEHAAEGHETHEAKPAGEKAHGGH